VTEAAIKSVVRSVGSTLGRELVRGILGVLRKQGRSEFNAGPRSNRDPADR